MCTKTYLLSSLDQIGKAAAPVRPSYYVRTMTHPHFRSKKLWDRAETPKCVYKRGRKAKALEIATSIDFIRARGTSVCVSRDC